MEYKGPYCYTLFLSGKKDKRIISKKISKGVVATFTKSVTQKLTPKIYILKYKAQIVYVGYASQPIGTRLGQGMRATGLNGYHGYKWKQVSELELMVFVFKFGLTTMRMNVFTCCLKVVFFGQWVSIRSLRQLPIRCPR